MAKLLLYSAMVAAGLCLGAIALFPAWLALGAGDLEAVGDVDLLEGIAAPATGSDATSLLDQAVAALDVREGEHERIQKCASSREEFDPSFVSELLRRNGAALALLEQALERGAFVFPEPPPINDRDADVYGGSEWTTLARLFALRSAAHLEAGRSDRALADAVAALRFGQLVESAHNSALVQAMFSVAIKTIGLRQLERVVARSELSPGRARELTGSLDAFRVDAAAWQRMWETEYRQMRPLFLELTSADAVRPASDEGEGWGWDFHAVPPTYLYQPRRTTALYADFMRLQQRNSERACASLEASDLEPFESLEPWDKLKLLLGRNSVGEILLRVSAGSNERYHLRRCELDSRLSAVQAMLALRSWEGAHGTLPDALDALVPEYLAAAPPDGFDEQPLRYSQSERRLWSAGQAAYAEARANGCGSEADSGGYPLPF